MTRIYLVQVDNKVSQLAYPTLEEAQEFIKSRLNDGEIERLKDNNQPYYSVYSSRGACFYTIIDVMVEMN